MEHHHGGPTVSTVKSREGGEERAEALTKIMAETSLT